MEAENQPGCGCLLMSLIVLPFMVIMMLALLGPAVGTVYSNITSAL